MLVRKRMESLSGFRRTGYRSSLSKLLRVAFQRLSLAQTSFSPPHVCAVVNRFLLSQVGSVFAAGTPELDSAAHLWRIPILYNPPDFTGDEVGHAQVSTIIGQIQQHTPAAELRERAAKLHERDKTQIHTAFRPSHSQSSHV
jgi:hypothetical protein